jgi:hypothetical protein
MEDDEDDMYAPDDVVEAKTEATHKPEIENNESVTRVKDEHEVENDEEDEEDNDEEEEEDDDDDSVCIQIELVKPYVLTCLGH